MIDVTSCTADFGDLLGASDAQPNEPPTPILDHG
jgi:hypothetical protein